MLDARGNRLLADRLAVPAVCPLEHELLHAVLRGARRACDLLQIMVVRQRPEDGSGRHAAARELPGESDGVEGFDEREKGPREEAHLMPGGDGHRAACRELPGQARGFRAATSKHRRRKAGAGPRPE